MLFQSHIKFNSEVKLSVIPHDTWISKFRTKSNPCFFYSNSLNKLRFHMNQIQVSCNQSSDGISKFRCSVCPSVLFVSTSLILCPSFFIHSIDPMLSSSPTNVVIFDKLYEAHCLGHASLISIITTINLLLVSINDVIKRNKNGGSRPYYPHIKRNR